MKSNLVKPECISVRNTEKMGRGVFADQNIEAGKVIEECHFIVSGCPIEVQDAELKRYIFSMFYDKKISAEQNQKLDFRSKFLLNIDDEEIANTFIEELNSLGYKDLNKIFSTATVLGYGMIYNHSQKNNIDYNIDYKDFCFRFTTNKEILKDEELFIDYNNTQRKDIQ
jgi:SET domain-containing protein